MNEKPRATDTEAVAALIWMSFAVPADVPPLDDDGRAYISFKRALDLYADTREREAQEAAAPRERDPLPEPPGRDGCPHPSEPVPEPDTADHFRDATKKIEPETPEPPAAQPPDTHTHTIGGRRPQK